MNTTETTPQYFALTKEVLQEVLLHLAKDPTAALYQKVAQALPVQSSASETTGTTETATN